MNKKQRPLYGIRISADGDMRRVQIPMKDKWETIKRLIRTVSCEWHEAGGFNGVRRIVIADRYRSTSGEPNQVATRLCGKPIYGTVILLKENADGCPVLMTDGDAYRMQLEVERGW